MKKKGFIFCLLGLISVASYSQDHSVKKSIELKAHYSLQRPFYSVNIPLDIVALPKDWRMRHAIGLDVRYYLGTRWFATYGTSFSQEGGGYSQQRTNANYWKNAVHLGYSAKQNRKLIFEMYTGLEHSILINAKFKDKNNGTVENIEEYLSNSFVSIPLGIGLKSRVGKTYFFTMDVSAHFGTYDASSQDFIKSAQIILPAFRFGISKFINR
ncbi:MAG: hypothetical protein Tsb0034_09840 [Ekhidna sp.]